jgi:hypothetical protein
MQTPKQKTKAANEINEDTSLHRQQDKAKVENKTRTRQKQDKESGQRQQGQDQDQRSRQKIIITPHLTPPT